jgi:hypothetical protein
VQVKTLIAAQSSKLAMRVRCPAPAPPHHGQVRHDLGPGPSRAATAPTSTFEAGRQAELQLIIENAWAAARLAAVSALIGVVRCEFAAPYQPTLYRCADDLGFLPDAPVCARIDAGGGADCAALSKR